MEDEEESIMDTNNGTADVFSHASSSQRENVDAAFTSEKLDKLDNLVDTINNLTIKDAGYELNKYTVSGAQGDLKINPDTFTHTSNGPDTVTHTSNRILDQKLLSERNIGEVSVFPPTRKPTIILMLQTLLTTVMKEISADTTSSNSWISRTPRQISRNDVDGSIPISTTINSGMRNSFTLASSDST